MLVSLQSRETSRNSTTFPDFYKTYKVIKEALLVSSSSDIFWFIELTHCGFLTLCKLGSSGLGGRRAGDHACLLMFTAYGIMKAKMLLPNVLYKLFHWGQEQCFIG